MPNPFENKPSSYSMDFPLGDSLVQEQDTDFKKRLKATLVGGYTKSSVEHYITELENATSQMRHSLTTQLKELMLEKETLSQEHKLLQSQSQKAEDRVSELQQEITSLTQETENFAKVMDEKVNSASQELKRAGQEAQKINESLKKVEALLEKKEGEVITLKERVRELESSLQETQERFEGQLEEEKIVQVQLRKQIEDLKQGVLAQSEEVKPYTPQEDPDLNVLNQSKENKENKWAKELQRIEREKKSLESTISRLRDENADLYKENESYLQVCEKLDLLHGQYKNLQEKNDLLEMDRQVSEEYIARYQLQEREHLILKKNSRNYRVKIQELEKETFDMLREMENQSKTIQTLMEKAEQDQIKIRSLIQEKTILQSNNVDYLEELRMVQKRLFELEALEREREEEHPSLSESEKMVEEKEKTRTDYRKGADLKDIFPEKLQDSKYFSKKASS